MQKVAGTQRDPVLKVQQAWGWGSLAVVCLTTDSRSLLAGPDSSAGFQAPISDRNHRVGCLSE